MFTIITSVTIIALFLLPQLVLCLLLLLMSLFLLPVLLLLSLSFLLSLIQGLGVQRLGLRLAVACLKLFFVVHFVWVPSLAIAGQDE